MDREEFLNVVDESVVVWRSNSLNISKPEIFHREQLQRARDLCVRIDVGFRMANYRFSITKSVVALIYLIVYGILI